MKVLIKKSTKPDKKYMAIFCDCDCKGKKMNVVNPREQKQFTLVPQT